MQFTDSDTVKVSVNYNTEYPTLQMNAVSTEYASITDIYVSDILTYNQTTSGLSYNVEVPEYNTFLLRIHNDNSAIVDTATIVLNHDLQYMQKVVIQMDAKLSQYANPLQINMNYYNSVATTETNFIYINAMPIDVLWYDTTNPTGSTYSSSHYMNTNPLFLYSTIMTPGSPVTTFVTQPSTPAALGIMNGDYVYIDNLYINSGGTVLDVSGAYEVTGVTSTTSIDVILSLDPSVTLLGVVKIAFNRVVELDVLRSDNTNTSSISNRYDIKKSIL
jgi:hypothetical protein